MQDIYLQPGSKSGNALNQRLYYWRKQQEKEAKNAANTTSVITNSSTITSTVDHIESQSKLVNVVPSVTLTTSSLSKQKTVSPLSIPSDLNSSPHTRDFFPQENNFDEYDNTDENVDLVLPTKWYEKEAPSVASLTDSSTTRRTVQQAQTNRRNEIDEQNMIDTMYMVSLLLWKQVVEGKCNHKKMKTADQCATEINKMFGVFGVNG